MNYAWNPTAAERSILGQIRNQQSLGQYNAEFGFTHFADFASFPQWAGVKLQNGSETHAAGAFQDEPATWTGIQAATGVPDFSPASQDIGNLWLLRTYGQQSQWATNFSDDGGHYVFAADAPAAPEPSPPVTGLTGTLTDNTGGTWAISLTKNAVAGMVGAALGAVGMAQVTTTPVAQVAAPVPPAVVVQQATPPQPDYLAEWEACYKSIQEGRPL